MSWSTDHFGIECCRETIRQTLKQLGLSWKKARKLLNKANQVRIFPYEKADRFNTIDVLKQLRVEFPDLKMTLVWDGAPYHRAQEVAQAASALEISLEPLPAYSPDFMPVEHLWQWLRADVTYHTCYNSKAELIEQVSQFQQQINGCPINLADRLWVKTHLDPEEEKLRVSK